MHLAAQCSAQRGGRGYSAIWTCSYNSHTHAPNQNPVSRQHASGNEKIPQPAPIMQNKPCCPCPGWTSSSGEDEESRVGAMKQPYNLILGHPNCSAALASGIFPGMGCIPSSLRNLLFQFGLFLLFQGSGNSHSIELLLGPAPTEAPA